MKSFLQFLKEMPQLFPSSDVGKEGDDHMSLMDHVGEMTEKYKETHSSPEIYDAGNHGDYSVTGVVHRFKGDKKIDSTGSDLADEIKRINNADRHHFYIIHRPSGKLVGRIDGYEIKPNEIHTEFARLSPDHRGKKLMQNVYSGLIENGKTLVSSDIQTEGGAALWKGLVEKHRDTAKLRHFKGKEVPIANMTDDQIFHADSQDTPELSGKIGFSTKEKNEHNRMSRIVIPGLIKKKGKNK